MGQKEKKETGDLPDSLLQTFSLEESGRRAILKEGRGTKVKLGFWDILVYPDALDQWARRETL